ncbi:ribonuclease H-like domain-containing protein [Tanacetum coccineum]
MPLLTYLNLGLDELAHTKLTVELADRTVKYPKGIAENVLVGIGKFVFPVDFIILDMPEDIKVPLILGRPFLSTAHAKIDVFKRKITLRVGEEKIIFKSIKPASSLIKRVYMLSLRERMELDLEARLMGETLVLNRSLDPFFGDYIELNDLNVPLELRRDQVDDLMPTIEEGEVVEEFRARNDARMVSKFFGYPSDCYHDKKIRIDCANNMKFSCMIDFAVLEDMDAYRDKGMGDVIFGEPFLREVGINAKRFEGMITIYNGNEEVTYQMVRYDEWNLHSYQKLKSFYKGDLKLGPEYVRDAKMEEWLTRGHISVNEMETSLKKIDAVGEGSTIWKSGSVGFLKLQDGCSTRILAHKLNLENLSSKISGDHTIDRCFKIIGYPADFRKRKVGSNFKGKNVSNNDVGSNSSNEFFDEQMTTLISLIKETSINGKGIHANTYMNSSTMFNKNIEKFFCSNSSMHSKLVSKGLITDSGANQRITYTDKNLTNVNDASYLKIKVTHPNGTEAFITKIGNIPLTNYLTLYDVLVVPEYCVSLTSVHKVARDSKLVIAFDEMHCYVMNHDLRKGKILGTGKQIGKLYYFDGNQGIEFENFKSNNVCFLSKQTWNCRLGHPADQVLDVLKSTLNFDNKTNDLICDTCQRAKQTREPFPLSDHVSTELGELVHLDLWGPYKVTSKDGFRFFLTIVDDFSRAVWVYLLKSKTEVFYNIMVIYNFIKTQFKKNIKVFKSNNGTEFVNQEFSGFRELNGIVHQTSCSYTPQQNGILERRHRHLLNVARSLLFQGGIPLNITSASLKENDAGHSQDAGGSASENGSFAGYEEHNSNSEGNGLHDQSQDNVSQDNNGDQNLRRSSRTSVFQRNFNDFIVDSKVKYSLEKYVNYSYLSKGNYCFATMLNKGVEPKTYLEASQHKHWVDAMNAKMDAL